MPYYLQMWEKRCIFVMYKGNNAETIKNKEL